MAAKTIKVEQLKLIRQLHQKGFSIKGIARSTGLSRNTIRKYLERLASCDAQPSASLQEDLAPQPSTRYSVLINHFVEVEKELQKTGVTRQHLWLEYKEAYPDGYNYSQYCYHFSEFLRHKEVVMHLEHPPGETVMIDFAGQKLSYIHPGSGEVIECQVFVSVLPCSGLIYCQAVHTQQTADFSDCINGMLLYYGGSPLNILCDNVKTAVSRPNRYEPVFTELCYQLTEHYGSCFSATRPYKPRDKAMVERSVNIVYQNIYAPLRKHVFHSLPELNHAIRQELDRLNRKPYKGSSFSRRDLFEQQEQALLAPLPREVFRRKQVVYATVQRNYHIQLSENRHYYSVPFRYVGKKVKVLYDNKVIEVYEGADRIAIHQRTGSSSAYHTIEEHMPVNHQQVKQFRGWTAEDLLQRASRVGEYTRRAAELILASSIYPQQNFKACHGMILLQNKYDIHRLEAACRRATSGSRVTYTMVCGILERGLDQQTDPILDSTLPDHENIRGPQHYQ